MSVTADKNQRLHHDALPFVFVALIINFPAGLILYWITTNFWTSASSRRPADAGSPGAGAPASGPAAPPAAAAAGGADGQPEAAPDGAAQARPQGAEGGR